MRPYLIATIVAVCLSPDLSGMAIAQDGQLSVTGEGVVSVEPDIAIVRMGVVAEGDTPQEAVDGMSTALAPVLVGLTDGGIAARDIQTGTLSLRPIYADRSDNPPDGEGPRITGYLAQSALSVMVRDLDALGGVLAGAVDSGSNTFDGLSWDLSDPEAAEDAALAEAVAEAARKAALMAQAAGVTLGEIAEIREGGVSVPSPGPMMMEARMASDMPVAAGSMDVRASVSIVYSLQDQ